MSLSAYIPNVPLTTFLFDLDGTLIDSIDLILRSYRHTMQHHRGEPLPPDAYWLEGLGTPLVVQFRRWTEDLTEIDAMIATYRDFNRAHHDALVRAYDGVAAEVLRLRDNGKRLGLVTSKTRDGAQKGLKLVGLEQAFDAIVGCDDCTNFKPHPEPVLTALRLLGADPRATVYIGDSRHDMACGRAAGVKTAAVLWGPFGRDHLEDTKPDYWLERPEQISLLTPDT